jgi:predicted tellurium resistance membrane protein TerC
LEIFTTENLIAFLTLAVLEIVLGIDNLVFIAIVSDRLKGAEASKARRTGLFFAVLVRLIFLSLVSFIVKLKKPIFSLYGVELSWKSLILLAGGLYLLVKSTLEIYKKVELVGETEGAHLKSSATFWSVVANIVFIDIIFSVESVITAVGLVNNLIIMGSAVIVAVLVMIAFVDQISSFIQKHASLKLLALAFLVLIGVLLIAEGTGFHFPRGYVYFSMAFAFIVQLLNIRYEEKVKQKKVKIEGA